LKDDIHVTTADATKTLDASGSNPAMHQGGAAILQPISFSGQMSTPHTDVGMTQTLQAKNPMAVAVPMTDRSDGTGTGPTVMQIVYELHSQDSRVRELKDVCTTVSATYGTGGGNVPITLKSQMAPTLEAGSGGNNKPAVHHGMAVRRLTPVECERLQGFGDNYTNIKDKCPDGPRYKALGNSMAVPVMAWIGKRIQEVEQMQCKQNK